MSPRGKKRGHGKWSFCYLRFWDSLRCIQPCLWKGYAMFLWATKTPWQSVKGGGKKACSKGMKYQKCSWIITCWKSETRSARFVPCRPRQKSTKEKVGVQKAEELSSVSLYIYIHVEKYLYICVSWPPTSSLDQGITSKIGFAWTEFIYCGFLDQ